MGTETTKELLNLTEFLYFSRLGTFCGSQCLKFCLVGIGVSQGEESVGGGFLYNLLKIHSLNVHIVHICTQCTHGLHKHMAYINTWSNASQLWSCSYITYNSKCICSPISGHDPLSPDHEAILYITATHANPMASNLPVKTLKMANKHIYTHNMHSSKHTRSPTALLSP